MRTTLGLITNMLDSNILLNIYVHYNDNSNSTVTLIFENKFTFQKGLSS